MRRTQQGKSYYTGQHALHYNDTWRTFLQKTLAVTLATIDVASLRQKADMQGRPLRLLDAACGTGLLLQQLSHLFPHAELYGIDASQAMLTQATSLLRDTPAVHLVWAMLGAGATAGLAYPSAFFDLVVCTNSMHYLTDPAGTLRGFTQHIRLYTLEEVQVLCQNAGILLEDARSFPIDLFCQGWVFRGQ